MDNIPDIYQNTKFFLILIFSALEYDRIEGVAR